jgi:hypothetical protein
MRKRDETVPAYLAARWTVELAMAAGTRSELVRTCFRTGNPAERLYVFNAEQDRFEL